MRYQALKTPFFSVVSFLGTCAILYYNPRFDWVTILWLLAFTAVLGLLHSLWERQEADYMRRTVEYVSSLFHAPEERLEAVPLRQGYFDVLVDEIQKSLAAQENLREQALGAREQMKRNMEDVTHQIKTPLTGILLFLDLLESDPEHGQEYMLRIRQEVEHLYNLSNLLLKISSFDAGAVSLKMEPFSVQGLLVDVEFSLEHLLRQKGVALEVVGDDYSLVGDRGWLMEALLNIVKNAVEVSPPGECVKVKLNSNSIFQSITVADRGPGLTLEQQQRVFERFYKSNPRSPGFGIGLPLAESIVRQHGGEILVRSSSQGGEFEVRFYRV